MLFVSITVLIFIRPEFAFAFALSTHSMTESCLTKLVDVTDEDTFSKVVDVVLVEEKINKTRAHLQQTARLKNFHLLVKDWNCFFFYLNSYLCKGFQHVQIIVS